MWVASFLNHNVSLLVQLAVEKVIGHHCTDCWGKGFVVLYPSQRSTVEGWGTCSNGSWFDVSHEDLWLTPASVYVVYPVHFWKLLFNLFPPPAYGAQPFALFILNKQRFFVLSVFFGNYYTLYIILSTATRSQHCPLGKPPWSFQWPEVPHCREHSSKSVPSQFFLHKCCWIPLIMFVQLSRKSALSPPWSVVIRSWH